MEGGDEAHRRIVDVAGLNMSAIAVHPSRRTAPYDAQIGAVLRRNVLGS